MTDTTLLVLSGHGVSPYSARGLSQSLTPIEASAVLRRTINGDLKDLSQAQFRKFKSTITCTDQNTPALEGVWPGAVLTVDCVSELSYKTAGGAPERPVVSGSSRVEGEFTLYRPRLIMRVVGYDVSHDEYQAAVGWTLDLEEV